MASKIQESEQEPWKYDNMCTPLITNLYIERPRSSITTSDGFRHWLHHAWLALAQQVIPHATRASSTPLGVGIPASNFGSLSQHLLAMHFIWMLLIWADTDPYPLSTASCFCAVRLWIWLFPVFSGRTFYVFGYRYCTKVQDPPGINSCGEQKTPDCLPSRTCRATILGCSAIRDQPIFSLRDLKEGTSPLRVQRSSQRKRKDGLSSNAVS